MKALIHKITGALGQVSQYLISFGPFGLFAIAFLDSVMVPMPGGVDAVLLLLAAARPSWLLIYVAAATIGSTIGCVALYRLSQRAGKKALSKFSESKQKRVPFGIVTIGSRDLNAVRGPGSETNAVIVGLDLSVACAVRQ